MKKKLIALLLTAAMTCATVTVPAFAAEVTEKAADEINLVATHTQTTDNQLNVSWINPAYEIASIKVTKSDGTDVSGDAISKTSGATNSITVTGLASGVTEEFTVAITKQDGSCETFKTAATVNSVDLAWQTVNRYANLGWCFEQRIDTAGGFFIDSAEKHSGNSSMKIVKNSTTSYIRMRTAYSVNFETGKTYRVSFWAKQKLTGGDVNWAKGYTNAGDAVFKNDRWNKYEYTFEWNSDDSKDFAIMVQQEAVGTAWIDDIEIREINEDTGASGSNLMTCGTFDVGTKITTNSIDAKAVITMTNPYTNNESNKIDSAVLLNSEGKQVAEAANLGDKATNKFTLEELVNDTIYDYTLKQVVNGVTEYIPVSVVPRSNTYNDGTLDGAYVTEDGYTLTGWDANNWGTDRVSLEIDRANYHGGNGALHLRFLSGRWGWLKYFNGVWNLDTNKKYMLSIWVKGNATGKLSFENTDGTDYILIDSFPTDWTKYTYAINNASMLPIRINEESNITGDIWIDDLAVYEVDDNDNPVTGENLLPSGAFDAVSVENILAVPKEETDGTITANITWDKVSNSQIRSVTIQDNSGNVIATAADIASENLTGATITGLTQNTEYTYRVVYDIAGDGIVEKEFTFRADNNFPIAGTMWTICETPGLIRQTLDTSVKHSGNASLKCSINYQKKEPHFVIPKEGLNKDKTYEISLWIKSEGVSGGTFKLLNDWADMNGVDVNQDWTRYTFKVSGQDKIYLRFHLGNVKAKAIWIDDVSIRECDDAGYPIGNSLLDDGGFEKTKNKLNGNIPMEQKDGKAIFTVPLYNAYTVTCFTAAYDADGNLIDVAVDEEEEETGTLSQSLTTEVNTAGAEQVRIFLWEGMNPITGDNIFDITQN